VDDIEPDDVDEDDSPSDRLAARRGTEDLTG
jgi:hypothetical protein